MDPFLAQLASGLAIEGLAALLSRSAKELSDDLVGFDHTITEALDRVGDVPAIEEALGGERLRAFLRSQEVVALVRRVYAGQMSDGDAPLDALRGEFIDLWSFQLGAPGADDERVGRLFDVILAACDGTLAATLDAGSIGALDARAARRQRLLLDKLDLVHSSIEAMRAGQVSAEDVDAFRERYRQLVRQREGMIVPPNFDAAPKVPIDDLYVESPLQSIEEMPRQMGKLRYDDLLVDLGCMVVLGNPGSGKSTLTKKLATDYALLEEEDGTRPSVPFRVVLRDYGAHKKEASCSIRDFIEIRLRADYQLDPPAGAVEYLLSAGAAVVIFDGLDELLETSYRREISADIETFTTLYPSVPLLVTSREVGYSQAPLDESLFDTYRLAPFSARQTREYVTKWFARERLSPAEREQQVRSFMQESESVTDLRSNPLMLALMCTIYRGEGYIPENRPDVYERCAVLLFDRWDRQRQIKVPLKIESHVRPAMQYLAHWIYTDAGAEAEVPESAIVEKATEYLLQKRYEDPIEAEEEARRFVEFCTGRAWVFTDVGTTSSGERLYDFTHTTFLEYFAAGHLVRTSSEPAALNGVLIRHIERREWDVVAQLAYQMLDRNVDGASEALLEELVPAEIEPDSNEQLNRLGFAVRTLDFLVPPPATTRRIATAAVTAALRWIDVRGLLDQPAKEPPGRHNFVDVVVSLASASPENLDVIQASLETVLVGAIRDAEGSRAVAAAELALCLGAHLPEDFDRGMIAATGPQLEALARADRPIALELVARGIVCLERYVDKFGIAGVFKPCGYRIQPRSSRPILGATMAKAAILPADERWALRATPAAGHAFLKSLAPLLLENPPPWYAIRKTINVGLMALFVEHSAEESEDPVATDLDADQWFSMAAILAALRDEAESYRWAVPQGETLGPLRQELEPIAPVVRARDDSALEGKARDAEAACGFGVDQQVLLRAWRAKEVSFAAVHDPGPR